MAGQFKEFQVKPGLLSNTGGNVNKIKINIGEAGAQGVQGPHGTQGAQGIQGTQGNPQMQLTAPNGAIYAITVADDGTLGTTLVQAAPPSEAPDDFGAPIV
jgi:hypothetical protein|tara:strand:+ start:133 stop:435 length:303 start_codon:yes stop_codon:yes gene_type:complete